MAIVDDASHKTWGILCWKVQTSVLGASPRFRAYSFCQATKDSVHVLEATTMSL
jgi:hypothetical protein